MGKLFGILGEDLAKFAVQLPVTQDEKAFCSLEEIMNDTSKRLSDDASEAILVLRANSTLAFSKTM